MNSLASREVGAKVAKGVVVGALVAAAIGLAAQVSSASSEASWNEGCRGYWYTTAGHGYCSSATNYPSYDYWTSYDCNVELDVQNHDKLYRGFVGKFDDHDCTFKINKTHVGT
ncbi:hypothetical protein [Streptomyces sp. NPDC088400]|uniref:hypothetical protein n=1 Tax=Streptomyces sp. NPDC088400 TaxID=3365861 RepID=UPI003800DF5E